MVTVTGRYDGEQVELVVSNPLPDKQASEPGNHMALQNIRHRLQSLYGAKANVYTERLATEYRATSRYPLVGGQ